MSNTPRRHNVGTHAFAVYDKPGYLTQLAADIAATKKGDRVLLLTMNFQPDDAYVAPVVTALEAAARRGVHADFSMDAHDFMLANHRRPGPLWYRRTLPAHVPKPFQPRLEALHRLYKAGAHVGVSNQPGMRFTSPFAGRSHIKLGLVNNRVYIGGCNLNGSDIIDAMVGWDDARSANWLYTLLRPLVATQSTRATLGAADHVWQVDDRTTLLVDAGVKDQSIIFDRALQAIDNATDWVVITCQFFPNSITAQALKRAQKRGVRVFPIFNHYRQHTMPNNLLQHSVTWRERRRMPANFFKYELPPHLPFMHAKLLATDKEFLNGSHNYIKAGVHFGTAEIALHRTDPGLSRQLSSAILQQSQLADNPHFAFLRPA